MISIYISRRFGNVPVLMIEAQGEHEHALAQLKRKHPERSTIVFAQQQQLTEKCPFSAEVFDRLVPVVADAAGERVVCLRDRSIQSWRSAAACRSHFFSNSIPMEVEVDILQGATETLSIPPS